MEGASMDDELSESESSDEEGEAIEVNLTTPTLSTAVDLFFQADFITQCMKEGGDGGDDGGDDGDTGATDETTEKDDGNDGKPSSIVVEVMRDRKAMQLANQIRERDLGHSQKFAEELARIDAKIIPPCHKFSF